MESTARVELPDAYENVDQDSLVQLIADMCERLMVHNDQIPLSPESLTRFHSRSPPNISVLEYLRRIARYTNVEKSCLLLTLHYMDQICAHRPQFTLSSLTCHRFVIASIAISSKGFCDAFCTNSHYAKVGGISVSELNLLEREFLSMIDWRLTCTRELLQEYYINLVRTHSGGRFVLAGALADHESRNNERHRQPTPSADGHSSDSDSEMGSPTTRSRAPSPSGPAVIGAIVGGGARHAPADASAGTILVQPAPFASGAATLEQNMAFQALQESRGRDRR